MTPTPSGKRKMILDVDTGIDDALALAYLVSFDDVEILGVIGTYGNVSADTAVRNTAYVLERLGFRDVPVMCGSTRPSWAAAFIPDAGCAQFHGTDGLGGFGPSADCAVGRHTSVCDDSNIQTLNPAPNVSDSSGLDVRAMRGLISVGGYDVHDPHANPAADSFSLSFTVCDAGGDNDCEDRSHSPVALPDGVRFLIDAVRFYGSDVTVVATGPLTDVDAALAAAPDITSWLRLVMMGGTLTQEGNCWDATAETNIIQDPEAADYLFHSGTPTTMIGLDVTLQTLLTYKETQQWRDLGTKAGKFLADMTDFYIKAYETTSPHLGGCGLHDPLAVGVAVDPTLVTTLDINMKVDVDGPTRGRTIGDETRLNDPVKTMKVAVGVDVPRFLNEFMTRISGLATKAE